MAKEELIEMQGVVEDILPDRRFRVELENGHNLVAYTAGRMKKTSSVLLPATASLLNSPRTT